MVPSSHILIKLRDIFYSFKNNYFMNIVYRFCKLFYNFERIFFNILFMSPIFLSVLKFPFYLIYSKSFEMLFYFFHLFSWYYSTLFYLKISLMCFIPIQFIFYSFFFFNRNLDLFICFLPDFLILLILVFNYFLIFILSLFYYYFFSFLRLLLYQI